MISCTWSVGDAGMEDAAYIRRRVFIEEQGISESVEMDGTDVDAIHLVAYDEGRPVATGRIRLSGEAAHIGRVAVLKDERGKGFGDFIMRVLVYKCCEMDYGKQVLNAQAASRGFYEKLGFTVSGEIFEEAGIPHVPMEHEGYIGNK